MKESMESTSRKSLTSFSEVQYNGHQADTYKTQAR